MYDSITKYYPNINIGGFAFKEYSVALEENILPNEFHIRLAINNIGFGNNDCSTLDTVFAIIQSWKEKNNTGFYCYPYGNTWVYPFIKTNTYKKLIEELVNNNFYQVRFHFYPDWYTQGLDIWLVSKMLWKPDINIDSLKILYYHSVYPKTHLAIQHFHNTLEHKINNLSVCVPRYSPGKKRLKEIFIELFSEEFLNETKNNLELELKKSNLNFKENRNISNFLEMIGFLKMEQNINSLNSVQKLLISEKNKLAGHEKIFSLRNTLILSGKSTYWNPKRSLSYYIQN